MENYKSLLDPNNQLEIDEKNWVIALLRNPNSKGDKEHAFLVLEGITSFGKVIYNRYDCVLDPKHKNLFSIEITASDAVDPKNRNEAFLDILNNETACGKAWSIRKQQAKVLHENISRSQAAPGAYNELGESAIFPKLVGVTGALSDKQKSAVTATIESGAVAVTGAASGPGASLMGGAALATYHALPNDVKESITGAGLDIIEMMSGASTRDYLESSTKPSGDNSYTWARNMLRSIDDKEIIRTLPKRFSDLVKSITSSHIDTKELKQIKDNHSYSVAKA